MSFDLVKSVRRSIPMSEPESILEDEIESICARSLCLSRTRTSIWLYDQDSDKSAMMIFRNTKPSIVWKAYDRLSNGLKTWMVVPVTMYRDRLTAQSPVRLELHAGQVCVKNIISGESMLLYKHHNNRFCSGFFFDMKVGFDLVGLRSIDLSIDRHTE